MTSNETQTIWITAKPQPVEITWGNRWRGALEFIKALSSLFIPGTITVCDTIVTAVVLRGKKAEEVQP